MDKRFLNEKELSKLIGRSLSTLRHDRRKGKGVPFIKIQRQVKYDLDDVLCFMESNKVLITGS